MTISGKTITVVNGGRLGSYQKNGTAITIGGGSTISGTGTLLIKNARVGGTWKGPIVMNGVTVSGLDGIAITNNATLAVGAGYSGATVPIAVRSGGTLRVDGVAQTGAVTLDNGAALTLALASGTLVVNGAITTAAADGKIRIGLVDQSVAQLSATNAWRILSATNLGATGATATVNDMRLYGGSHLSATRTAGNTLAGNVAIFGSTTDPVLFQIEVNKGPGEPYRALQLQSPISGSGSVRCIYAPGHVNDNYTPSVNGVVSGSGILRKTGAGTLLLNAENTLAAPLTVKQGLIGGTGKITAVELANGTGFDVSATQSAPIEIGSLTVNGGIALNITDFATAHTDKVAVAKVGTLSGTLPDSPVSMTIDGRISKSLRLSLANGIIYAMRSPFILILR